LRDRSVRLEFGTRLHVSARPAAPRAELEEIVWLVSHAWGDAIIAVGGACNEGRDQMHVVAKYTDYEVMIFDLKKTSGHWHIVDHGEGTPTISSVWYGC